MRREIETVPKDGKSVILEDDARKTYALAHWSTEQSAWVGEDGKPISITPTHWLPLQRNESLIPHLLQREAESCDPPDPPIRHLPPLSSGQAALEWPPAQNNAFALRRDARAAVIFPVIEPRTATSQPEPRAWPRLVVSSIAAAMIASSLIGMYFRASIVAYVTQYADQHDIAKVGRIVEEPSKQAIPLPVQELRQADQLGRAPAVQARGKSEGSGEQTVAWEAVQTTGVSQATETLEKKSSDAAAPAPQSPEPDREKGPARQELTANEVQYRKALAEERDRSATLASELATAQRNVEMQVVQSNKTANEATELKKAADTAASELERAEALASELAKVRREVEAAAAVPSQKDDEAAQLKKDETATAELQLSLQQERQRAETLSSDLGKVRRELEALATLASQKDDEAAQLKKAETGVGAAEVQQSLQQERPRTETRRRRSTKRYVRQSRRNIGWHWYPWPYHWRSW
jgi:hypothetical protein